MPSIANDKRSIIVAKIGARQALIWQCDRLFNSLDIYTELVVYIPTQQCRPPAGSGPETHTHTTHTDAAPSGCCVGCAVRLLYYRQWQWTCSIDCSIDRWANLATSRALAYNESRYRTWMCNAREPARTAGSAGTTTHSTVASSLVKKENQQQDYPIPCRQLKNSCIYPTYSHFVAHAHAGLSYLWLCANAHRRFMECVAVRPLATNCSASAINLTWY